VIFANKVVAALLVTHVCAEFGVVRCLFSMQLALAVAHLDSFTALLNLLIITEDVHCNGKCWETVSWTKT